MVRSVGILFLLVALAYGNDLESHMVQVHNYNVGFPTVRGYVVPSPMLQINKVRGNGICIDRNCSVIATAWHIQQMAGRGKLEIGRAQADRILTANSVSNGGAGRNSSDHLPFDLANDVAFIFTRKPVPHKSGFAHSYKAYVGEKVTIVFYNDRTFNTKEARIIGMDVHL